jgi:hypothetical protein
MFYWPSSNGPGQNTDLLALLCELARRAFTEPAPVSSESFLGFQPLPNRGGVVTDELINRLL